MILKNILTNKNILFVVTIGSLLRFYNIGDASLWEDEILSLNAADRISSVATFFTADSENAHPPLYFLILKFWKYFGNSESYLRILSALFGIISIYIFYLLANKFFPSRTAYISSAIISFSPFLIRFDREVRMYSLFMLLTILSIYFLLVLLKSNRKKDWALFSFFSILSLYTHYHSIIVLFSCFIYYLISNPNKNNLKPFITSFLFIALAYSFWVSSFLQHLFAYSDELSRFPSVYGFWIQPIYVFYCFTLGQSILPWQWYITVPSAIICFYLIFIIIKKMLKNKEQKLFLLLFLLLPIIIVSFFSEVMPRYMIFIYPIYILFLSNSISYINKTLSKVILFLVILIYSISINNFYNERNYHILASTTPWKEIAEIINLKSDVNDVVLNVGNSPSLDYYLIHHSQFYNNDVYNRITKNQNNLLNNYWIISANPAFNFRIKDLIDFFEKDDSFSLSYKKQFKRDNNYKIKKRFFNKEFSEYRAEMYYYKKIIKEN